MTPNNMPPRSGLTPPRPAHHHDDCRCLDCIDWAGEPVRPRRPGITASSAYRRALAAVTR